MLNCKKIKTVGFSIAMGPKTQFKQEGGNTVAFLFSCIFQLLPVWIMILIQYVTVYCFSIGNITDNLLVFVFVACATNLSDVIRKNNITEERNVNTIAITALIVIFCFSVVLYTISLLKPFVAIQTLDNSFFLCSVFFTLLTCMIGAYLIAKESSEREIK